MSYIDKLIPKLNKAKNKFNSVKGIVSDIQTIHYDAGDNIAQETKDKALSAIRNRNKKAISSQLGNSTISEIKQGGKEITPQMIYPKHDALANYIVFNIRPRKHRGSSAKKNVHKDQSIALYIPDTLISQSNVTYAQQDITALNRTVAKVFEELTFDNVMDQATPLASAYGVSVANKLTGGLQNIKQGVATNPQSEQLLNNVPFRSWDFTFDFFAKSAEEQKEINKIIYTFRSSMLPETFGISTKDLKHSVVQAGATFLDTPSADESVNVDDQAKEAYIKPFFNLPNVFDISFAGPIEKYVDGFLPAVCTNAQVDYTGGQKFGTRHDGSPNRIQLTLNFLEINIMSLGNYQSIASTIGGGADSAGAKIDDAGLFETSTRDGYTTTGGIQENQTFPPEMVENPYSEFLGGGGTEESVQELLKQEQEKAEAGK